MRVKFIAVASAVVVDRFTNRMTLFNLIDTLAPQTLPSWIPEVIVGAIVHRSDNEPGNFRGALVVLMHNQELSRMEIDVDFQGANVSQLVIGIQGLGISSGGDVEFRLQFHGADDGVYRLTVLPPAPAIQLQAEPHSAQPATH